MSAEMNAEATGNSNSKGKFLRTISIFGAGILSAVLTAWAIFYWGPKDTFIEVTTANRVAYTPRPSLAARSDADVKSPAVLAEEVFWRIEFLNAGRTIAEDVNALFRGKTGIARITVDGTPRPVERFESVLAIGDCAQSTTIRIDIWYTDDGEWEARPLIRHKEGSVSVTPDDKQLPWGWIIFAIVTYCICKLALSIVNSVIESNADELRVRAEKAEADRDHYKQLFEKPSSKSSNSVE